MRKLYKLFMVKLFLIIFILFSSKTSEAQIDITIGTGTLTNAGSTYPCPLQDFYEANRSQYLYKASELIAAGMGPGNITALKWNVTSLGTFTGSVEQFSIRIGTTSVTTLNAATWEPGTVQVRAMADYAPTVGLNTFTFSTPFFWNGSDNLIVEVCNGDPNNATLTTWTSNPLITWTTGLSFNGSHNYRADGLGNFCGVATTTNTGNMTDRPNVVFAWISAVACSGVPTGGTTVAVPAITCATIPFDLSVTGSTLASGLTYQWQSSPDNINWTPMAGLTASTITTTQMATTWYRRAITCTGSGQTSFSTPVQVTSPSLVGGTFTINNGAPTGGTNFNSFNDAYSYIKCGINAPVIFNVVAGSGPYTEQLIMQAVPGASNVNTVTWNGNGRTLQYLSTNTNERAVIKLDGVDHFRFNNLNITALGTATTDYGYGVQLMNDADSNKVANCNINIIKTSTSANFAGIVMNFSATSATTTGDTKCDANEFNGNTVTGGYYGITMVGSTTQSVARNKVINNKFYDQYFYGMYLLGNFDALIEANEVARPTRTGNTTLSYGIYVTSLNTKLIINKNKIWGAFEAEPTTTNDYYAITHAASDALATLENLVTNNIIYNMKTNGTLYGIYNASSDNVWYYHNTIVFDYTASTSSEVVRGFYQITAAGGIEFKNNIVQITQGGTAVKHAIYMGTNTTTYLSNRNNFDVTPGTNNFVGFFNANQATLANWQTAATQDANSVTLNPLFINAAIGNLKPTNASMNDLGEPVGVADDIVNVARNATTPDIGAYEFTPAPCVAPPTAGTSTTSATGPVCPGTLASFNLTGNTIGLTQTYQWEFSTTISGTYTNVGTSSSNSTLTTTLNQSGFYRCKVTCAGNTSTSVAVGVIVNQALAGGTYTINSTLPASATNFVSFNAAYQAMKCGIAGPIILNVTTPANTVYNEQLLMDNVAGMSAVNTVTWNGNSNIIRFASLNANERSVIRLNGVKFMRFDGIKVEPLGSSTTEYGHGFHLQNNSDSNIVRNCTVTLSTATTSTTFAGIVISGGNTATTTTTNGCDVNLIENNTIIGGYYGITVAPIGTGDAINNKLVGNKVSDFYLYGIYVPTATGTLVELNEISMPTRTAVTTTYGIYNTGTISQLKISKNRIFDFFKNVTATTSVGYGIYSNGDGTTPNDIEISNNAIYNFKGQGTAYGIYVFSNYSNLWHNTIDFNDQTFTGATITYCIYYAGSSVPTTIRDNNLSITKAGGAQKFGIYFSTVPSTYTSNHNNFYINGSNAFAGYNGANRATLTDWQTATTQDANSVSANPFYISPATGNFMPFSAQMDNRGAPVGITTDILNAARSATTPDIGAWEYSVPPCTAPPVVATATATPNTAICMGTDIALKLTGIVFGSGQTYQWQTATAVGGPYTNFGGVLQFPDTTVVSTSTLYYRCVVTCSGQSTNSSSALVTLNSAFLAGTYTINPALPASATNFTSFNTAVAALYCGITGHVIFNVATGTHTEQVRVGRIPGVGPNATVTFQSATGNNNDVTLTFNPTIAANNYTLLLDSTGYFRFNNITITGTNATNNRIVELRNTANNNIFYNNKLTALASTGTVNTSAVIFGNTLQGLGANNFTKNTITGGNYGISLNAASAGTAVSNTVIDSNSFINNYNYSMFIQYLNRVKVRANTVTMAAPRNATTYGMYIADCDSTIVIDKNIITMAGLSGTYYGMYLSSNGSTINIPGFVTNNKITANNTNSGTAYGMYQTASDAQKIVNNVISVHGSSTTLSNYGLYHTNGAVDYENNTVLNLSPSSSTTNMVAYLSQTSATTGRTTARNNVFAHQGGGRVVYMANSNFLYSDYNLLHTTGATFGTFGTTNILNFLSWVNTTNWDYNSISHPVVFTNNTDLIPNIADPLVWGMHGRGVQLVGNDKDFNGAARPVTLQQGVPDLGAYEFVPTSIPNNMIATPATPVANGTQKFSMGTDTVAVIKWGASIPASITGKRFTGTVPPALAVGQQYMYFYTDFDVPPGTYNYQITQNYMDPWRGFIPSEAVIRLGRTNAANTWIVAPTSTVDSILNEITEPNLSFVDKYTGLTDGTIPPPPPIDPIVLDSSNMGTRFWVGYGHHQFFPGTNSQEMVLYLGGATTASTVTVRINGTPWTRTYNIPANTVITSDLIPKSGLFDARYFGDGFSDRSISITSNVPIVAYAHIYGSASSGATMLMPVGVYGYEYYATTFRQSYASDCYSWFYVIADRNNTKIEITPANITRDGRPANVPFVVTLNKGEAYQVLGAISSGSNGYDMSGSKARSLPNSDNKCHPFAMFSGSSRTYISCAGTTTGGGGDNLIQQNFPSQAWGKRYLTAPTSNSSAANSFHQNVFRVVVKDATTIVQRNGVTLTGLVNGRFYEFDSQTADYITSDKPVMVAQYMSSTSSNCANSGGDGDPEMIYISPIEQGVKSVVLYRNTQQAITTNDIQVIIPNGGVPSLRIDGGTVFNHTYPHPNLAGYTIVIKRYTAAPTQATVKSDSAFTIITYGLGSVESYGYNGGTLVKNLNAVTSINNTLSTGTTTSPYTCAGTPFRFRVLLSVQPTQMTWQFSQVNGLSPNTDVVVNNPTFVSTQIINGTTYYLYTLATDYNFAAPGNYVVPVNIVHPTFEGCNSSQDITVPVTVLPKPAVNFTTTYSGCVGDIATFNGTAVQNGTVTTTQWNWNFGDATTGTGNPVTKQYATAGTYNVKLNAIGSDGCLGDTTKPVVVNPRPVVALVSDSLSICLSTNGTFTVQNPVTGATYNWYNAATGGTLLGTGVSYTFNNVTATTQVWVEGIVGGCASVARKRGVITVLPLILAPVVTVDTVGVNLIRWKWNAVANASSYSVSINNGTTWTSPSSGLNGLTHTVTGLAPLTSVTLLVRANGGCQNAISTPITGKTLTDQIYMPNSFSPNGDGLNDVWKVYGYVIKDIRIAIFNQWGERIFESRNQSQGWNGEHKGKKQPAGVYMYVVEMTLNDGSKQTQKGSINLIY